jgi:hypothetical protein
VYPEPDDSTIAPIICPAELTTACADAPDPPPPKIVMVGKPHSIIPALQENSEPGGIVPSVESPTEPAQDLKLPETEDIPEEIEDE